MNQLPRILAQQGLFTAARAVKRTNDVGMTWGTFSSQGLCLAGRMPLQWNGHKTHGVLSDISMQTAAMRSDQLDQAMVLALRSKFGGFSFENGVYRRMGFGLEAARIRNNTKIGKKMQEGREMLSDVKTEMAAPSGHDGLMTKFRSVLAEYGKVAFTFHVTGVALTTSACYAALNMGLDVDSLVHMLPDAISSHISEEMGTLALALLLCEMTAPPRYALTIVAAPKIAERIRGTRYGLILGLRAKRNRKLSMAYLPGRSPRATTLF